MRTVLSAFAQRHAARAAAAGLRDRGLTRGSINVRVWREGDDPSRGNPVDEILTGGALTDFAWLLGHLFGSAGPERPDSDIAAVVREGGAVVVVDADDDEEAARVQSFLLDAGATKKASVPREGDLD